MMEPTFGEVKHLLIYFTVDKMFFTYETHQVKGWCSESFKALKMRNPVFLHADYDFVSYKVRFTTLFICLLTSTQKNLFQIIVVQAAITKEELKDTKDFCTHLKKFDYRLEFIVNHFKPVRIPGVRQCLPPLSVSSSCCQCYLYTFCDIKISCHSQLLSFNPSSLFFCRDTQFSKSFPFPYSIFNPSCINSDPYELYKLAQPPIIISEFCRSEPVLYRL